MGTAKVTIAGLKDKKAKGEKITMLTAYDFYNRPITMNVGVDTVLVGDSVGMVRTGL
jgi:3-methyl-2-oxobutanoate hydroxymethyltransferase